MTIATPEQKASWPAPNFDNPESRSAIILGLTAPSLVLVVIFLCMRFYGKGVLRSVLGIDDWFMLAAVLASIPVSIIALESLNFGLGIHIWDQKPEWHEPYSKMAFAADILFPISCSLTKISLCLTYLRLFPSRTDKIFNYVLSAFVTLYTIACIFLMLFQCKPIRGYWDTSLQFKCINMRMALIIIAGLNSLSDFLIYLWPAKPLWSLQLPKKQRLGLIVLFSVGCTVCIAGVARMYYLEKYFESYDLLWHALPIYAVMTIEMNLGLICGCLSGVKPVFAVIFPRLFGSSAQTRTNPTAYGGRTGRSTIAESFPFQPLSDVSNVSKSRDQKTEYSTTTLGAMRPEEHEHRNLAWASASGTTARPEVPHNAIAVQTIVVREEEDVSPTPKSGDADSEEWIMEDVPNQKQCRGKYGK